MSTTTSHAGASLGHRLADHLGLEVLGTEGHDLKVACPGHACQSGDACRIHQTKGTAFCFSCGQSWSPFTMAESLLGDRKKAIDLMVQLGVFDAKTKPSCKPKNEHKHGSHKKMPPTSKAKKSAATKSGPLKVADSTAATEYMPCFDSAGKLLFDPIERVATAKGITKAGLLALGARAIFGTGEVLVPSFAPDLSPRREFSMSATGKGRWPRRWYDGERVAGIFMPIGHDEQPLKPSPDQTWGITEGAKDCAALHSLGFLAAGLPTNRMAEEFSPLFSGVHVVIVPDRDCPGVTGAKATFERLVGYAASIRVAELPLPLQMSKGADVRDCLRLPNGEQLVRDAIENATLAIDYFTRPELIAEIESLGGKLDSSGPDDGDDQTDADNSQPQHARGDGGELDPEVLAEWYIDRNQLDGYPTIRYWRGSFMRYCDGHYTEIPAVEVRADILRRLREAFTGLTQNVIGNAFEHVRASVMLDSRLEPPCWIHDSEPGWTPNETLVMRNGLVNLPNYFACKPHLLPPTPKFFATSAIDYDFDAEAAIPERWLNFLGELWGDDDQSIATLQEWMGYCTTHDTRQQKCLMLVGPRRSGKGTVCRIMSAVVGSSNVAGPTLSSLSDRFGLWPLLDKTLAIFADVRLSGRADQAVIVERLLSITGEDRLTIDKKSVAPVTMKLPVRLMLVSNELPRLSDSSGALIGRLLLLQLNRSFYGEEDPHLLDKLMPELPGILLWALQGWRRLRERGRFTQPDSSLELLGELSDLSSPVGQFVRERCVVDAESWVASSEIYQAWCDWCEQTGRREPGTIQTFGRDLHAVVAGLKPGRLRNGQERIRGYHGIRLKDW